MAEEAERIASGTKMPNFRLNEAQIRAISAYIWQSAFTVHLPQQKAGQCATAKKLFETRGCWRVTRSAKAQQQGGTFARQSDPRRREGQLRLPGALGSQRAGAHRAILPYEKKDIGPEDYAKKGLPYVFDLRAQQVPQRRPRTASAEHDRHAEPAPTASKTRRHRHVSAHAKNENLRLYATSYMDDPQAEGRGHEVDPQLRLRRMPRDRRHGRRAAHRHGVTSKAASRSSVWTSRCYGRGRAWQGAHHESGRPSPPARGSREGSLVRPQGILRA